MNEHLSALHNQHEIPKQSGIVGGTCYWVDSAKQVQSVQLEQQKAISLNVVSKQPYAGISFPEYGFPIEARLERVDVQFINRGQRPHPKYETIFIGQLHANEQEAPKLFDEQASTTLMFPHLKVMEAHVAASVFNRREIPLPIAEKKLHSLDLNEIVDMVILTAGPKMSGIGLDEVVEAYHEDIAQQKLEKIFQINPECAQALALQNEIKIIKELLHKNQLEFAQQKLDLLKPKLIALANSKEWVVAKNLNLNRQFPIGENVNDWNDIEKEIHYPEAKMFLQLIKDNPDLKYLFSIHEDQEHGSDDEITYKQNAGKAELLFGNSGVYFYDSHFDANNDPDKELIGRLHQNFVNKSISRGFRIFTGCDSDNDLNLGFSANQGYIDQPSITKDGIRAESCKALEDAFVEIGRLGLTGKNGQKIQAERAFCLEVPGRLSSRRKVELLKIYQEEFVVPFLVAHGIN